MKSKNQTSPKAFFLAVFLFAGSAASLTQAQTWLNTPSSGDWNTGANWDTSTVPNASSDFATLGATGTSAISLSASVTLDTLRFISGAPSYTVDTGASGLYLMGSGLTNSSGGAQTILNNGSLNFLNNSTAANAAVSNGGNLFFQNASSASSATIDNENTITFLGTSTAGNSNIANNSFLSFLTNSTAENAVINTTSYLAFNNNSTAANSSVTNSGFMGLYNNATLGGAAVVNNQNLYFFDSSTAGTASLIDSFYMSFQDGSTAGAATLTIQNGGTVDFKQTATGGTARIILNSGGNADISANSSSVTVGSIEGAGNFYLGANGLTAGVNGLSTTFSGMIDEGNGALASSFTKDGAGTMTLTGVNYYDGGTTIAGGKLVVETGAQLGSGTIVNNAALDYVHDSAAGPMTIVNNLTLNFWNNSTAGDSTLNNGGALYFRDDSTAEDSILTVDSGGSVMFNDDSSGGAARVMVDGGGLMDISGHSGGVTVGSLEGGGSFTLGANDLVEGGNDLSTQISGVIGGSGSLTKLGGGTLTLTGNNTYSGATSINGGAVAIFSDANLGSGGILVLNGGTLLMEAAVTSSRNVLVLPGGFDVFDTNGFDSTLSGVISGTGPGIIVKAGAGNLNLTSSNTHTFDTWVTGGTLTAGNADALGFGTLEVKGGTFATSGPLTVQVGRDYLQGPAGVLSMGVSDVGHSDYLTIGGAAVLDGTLGLFSYNNFQPQIGDAVTILTANNGITGRFQQWTNPVGFRWLPVYQPNNLLVVSIQPSFTALGLTPNQRSVGNWLDDHFTDSTFENVVLGAGTENGSALPAIYDLIAPEELARLYQWGKLTEENHSSLVEQRLADLRGGEGNPSERFASWDGTVLFAADLPSPQLREMSESAQGPNRWGVFVVGNGNLGNVENDGNSSGYSLSVGGITAGMDYRFGKDFDGGLLLGYSQAGKAAEPMELKGGQWGLYGDFHPGDFYLEALGEGGINSYQVHRLGYGGTASGTTSGLQFSGWLDLGYDWKLGNMSLGPYASGQFTLVQFDGFSEKGSLAPLLYPAQNQESLRSECGAKMGWSWKAGGITLLPRMNFGWEHSFQGTADEILAGLSTVDSFKVQGPVIGQDALVLGAGLDLLFAPGLSLILDYQGKFGMVHFDSQAFRGGVAVGF